MARKNIENKLVIISGGGTGGPSIVPLSLAQAYKLIDPDARFLFIGSNKNLEKSLFSSAFRDLEAEYKDFPAGKWRRYFSLLNFLDIFKIIYAFFKAIILLNKLKPDLLISAGSFASVPIVWAAYLLRIKILIHQQDLRPGLANKLMAPCASVVSTAFEKSVLDYGKKAVWIGNPSYLDFHKNDQLEKLRFKLERDKPTLFVTGGASGSLAINKLLEKTLPLLPSDWQIVHQTGKGKKIIFQRDKYYQVENFNHFEFLQIVDKSDLIVSRAGLGSLTEFSRSNKVVVLIPMPNTHQEDNAQYFSQKQAAIYLKQNELDAQQLADELTFLWQDESRRQHLSENIKNIIPAQASQKGAKIMKELIYEATSI